MEYISKTRQEPVVPQSMVHGLRHVASCALDCVSAYTPRYRARRYFRCFLQYWKPVLTTFPGLFSVWEDKAILVDSVLYDVANPVRVLRLNQPWPCFPGLPGPPTQRRPSPLSSSGHSYGDTTLLPTVYFKCPVFNPAQPLGAK